ncbi:restriction endonuclease subunit S [Klebsiella quasipneumoniae]|uniref:restriction endonuclease subunit S n=1 Tax=Klebsiella quasipneumoniae TaxID=1463165 RepID=UPI001BD996E0|nr:restriction endonuclease subunit S [Klebsiella quasipneumoniae]MBT0603994.1 restriction endonuclease subunit S [Klebsiella quasipneumoniae]MBY7099575.1 restriction endonuclease subunit S [Klebsiella quasipneumoniae]
MAKYKAYPEYKDSEVEWFDVRPLSWKVTRLKLETFMNMGQSPSSDDCNIEGDGLAFLQGNAEFGKVNPIEKQYCPVAKKIANPGDILFSVRAPVGAMNFADKKYGIGRGLCSISASEKVTSPFLWWLLPTYKYQLDAIATGSTFEAVSAEQLGNLCFALPSISEQSQIAAFLDHETAKIDNLIEKQQQLIELLKEKRQAVISHAVTKGLNPDVPMKDSGVEWLGEVPEHWSICRIKQLSKQISKGTTPSTIGGDFVDAGIRFLKAENIGKSKFVNSLPEFYISNDVDKQISRSRLQERDVLVIIAGATTGMVSVLQKEMLPANTNQAVSFIRTKNINHADWLYYWLGTDIVQRIIGMGAVQAAQPNLSMEDLGNIPILLPEQNELASICMEIEKQFVHFDSLICKAESAIDLMQERRTALISAAVTGKIDVRDWVAPALNDAEVPQVATA